MMIAPANFGSPLAHKGKSFIGRVTKGFNGSKVFETGILYESIMLRPALSSPVTLVVTAQTPIVRFPKLSIITFGKI
ncbi:MAG: hypothetical protein P8X74_21930 [Reinekea sp.]